MSTGASTETRLRVGWTVGGERKPVYASVIVHDDARGVGLELVDPIVNPVIWDNEELLHAWLIWKDWHMQFDHGKFIDIPEEIWRSLRAHGIRLPHWVE